MPKASRAFTLVEVLAVGVVLLVLTALVSRPRIGCGRLDATRITLQVLNCAMDEFKRHALRYPTTQEGLRALIIKPDRLPNELWRGSYLNVTSAPKDAYNTDFRYIADESGNGFDLVSAGPDKIFGTADDIRLSPRDTPPVANGGMLADRI